MLIVPKFYIFFGYSCVIKFSQRILYYKALISKFKINNSINPKRYWACETST